MGDAEFGMLRGERVVGNPTATNESVVKYRSSWRSAFALLAEGDFTRNLDDGLPRAVRSCPVDPSGQCGVSASLPTKSLRGADERWPGLK